ncbi:MAG: IS66 family transposase [Lachnoclostridium sp.]|nr:IS66 family transposase [Lachnoclostridium sp.]
MTDAEEIPETAVRKHTRKRKKKPALEEQFKGAAVNRGAPALIEKSYATSSLMAGILKNKFVLGLPFYR